jgi:hypothetical protein
MVSYEDNDHLDIFSAPSISFPAPHGTWAGLGPCPTCQLDKCNGKTASMGKEEVPATAVAMAVDPAGNVCAVAIATNRAESNAQYHSATIKRLKKKGWHILDDGDFTAAPDADALGNVRFTVTGAAALAEIAARRAAHAETSKQFSEIGKSESTKAMEQMATMFNTMQQRGGKRPE